MIEKEYLENEFINNKRTMKEIGTEFNVSTSTVKYYLRKYGIKCKIYKGRSRKSPKLVDLTGKIFGNYTVIEQAPGNGHCAFWFCKCRCGITKRVKGPSLRDGHTKSCGNCIYSHAWKGYEELSNRYFNDILKSAQKRGLECTITIEYCWELFLKQDKKCALSGQELKLGKNYVSNKKTKLTQTASLDRIDNSKGYIPGNVQWLHKDINMFKHSYEQDLMLYWVKRIYEYNNLSEVNLDEYVWQKGGIRNRIKKQPKDENNV